MKKQLKKDILHILDVISKGEKKDYKPNDFNLSEEDFENAIQEIKKRNFLKGYSDMAAGNHIYIFHTSGVSDEGEEFIKYSNPIMKFFKDVIKCISELFKIFIQSNLK
ncbi:MAG: YjcQ family protein [Clostridium butyricum]